MNRYMPKPYRCNLCLRSFNTLGQAKAHWLGTHAASADTHPKGGDSVQHEAPFMSGAVPKADAQNTSFTGGSNG